MEIDDRQHFQYRTGKKCKTLCIIVFAVDLLTGKIIFIVDEQIAHAVCEIFKDTAVLIAPCQLDIKTLEERHLFAPFLSDLAVQRADNSDLTALGSQCLRQRTGNVTQTAGLDKRCDFACNV